jgi:hypothetical protein
MFTGVADGVGGWTRYGIDAGEFSSFLMRTCERLVQSSSFSPNQPVNLLSSSYHELLDHKKPILGKFSMMTSPIYVGIHNGCSSFCLQQHVTVV